MLVYLNKKKGGKYSRLFLFLLINIKLTDYSSVFSFSFLSELSELSDSM